MRQPVNQPIRQFPQPCRSCSRFRTGSRGAEQLKHPNTQTLNNRAEHTDHVDALKLALVARSPGKQHSVNQDSRGTHSETIDLCRCVKICGCAFYHTSAQIRTNLQFRFRTGSLRERANEQMLFCCGCAATTWGDLVLKAASGRRKR